MTEKQKIKYLSQYKYLDREIDRKQRHIEEMRARLERTTPSLSLAPLGAGAGDKMAGGVAKILDWEKEVAEDIDRLVDLKREIEGKIDKVDKPNLREILKCRYLDCMTWEEVAAKTKYDCRWVHRLHRRALEQIRI